MEFFLTLQRFNFCAKKWWQSLRCFDIHGKIVLIFAAFLCLWQILLQKTHSKLGITSKLDWAKKLGKSRKISVASPARRPSARYTRPEARAQRADGLHVQCLLNCES